MLNLSSIAVPKYVCLFAFKIPGITMISENFLLHPVISADKTSVGITNKLMGGPPWRAIARLENFFRGPLWEGPNLCKFCRPITPTTDFISYSKENLKIHTGVPSSPFLHSLTLPSLSSPPPAFPPSPTSPPFLYPPSVKSRAP